MTYISAYYDQIMHHKLSCVLDLHNLSLFMNTTGLSTSSIQYKSPVHNNIKSIDIILSSENGFPDHEFSLYIAKSCMIIICMAIL